MLTLFTYICIDHVIEPIRESVQYCPLLYLQGHMTWTRQYSNTTYLQYRQYVAEAYTDG